MMDCLRGSSQSMGFAGCQSRPKHTEHACTAVLPEDAGETVGRKALHLARSTDRAHWHRTSSRMQAPCSHLPRPLCTVVATMRLHRGCKAQP